MLSGINISQVLQTVQTGDLGEQGVEAQLLILELMNVMILTTGGRYSQSLKEIYSENTFKLLLKLATSSQEQQNTSARETFAGKIQNKGLLVFLYCNYLGLLKTSGVILQSGMDLDLLLSLGKISHIYSYGWDFQNCFLFQSRKTIQI